MSVEFYDVWKALERSDQLMYRGGLKDTMSVNEACVYSTSLFASAHSAVVVGVAPFMYSARLECSWTIEAGRAFSLIAGLLATRPEEAERIPCNGSLF